LKESQVFSDRCFRQAGGGADSLDSTLISIECFDGGQGVEHVFQANGQHKP
jgi:hypothetical protein